MSKVALNKYGFYSVVKKPTQQEIDKYYAKYYEESKPLNYNDTYTDEELLYFNNKIEQRYQLLHNSAYFKNKTECSLLDVGCGEGIALNFFKKAGWQVLGLDFTSYGCESFNSGCVENLMLGDINESMKTLIADGRQFDVIWLDNILEHVLEPLDLLKNCKKLSRQNGFLFIEVPNDFSVIQNYLLNNKLIDEEFWVVIPEHLSYFNKEGLINLCKKAEFESYKILGDFPIDINLFNENANYVKDRSIGRSAHLARVKFENLIHKQSVEKTNALYESMADLGIGRSIIGFFINN